MYPAFPTGYRKATKDYQVPGSNLVLKKGTVLWIPRYAIQRDAEYYPNPDQFNPDHFTKEAQSKRDPYTFLAFGDGPRNCIGLRFANLQSKIGIATIIDCFNVTLSPRTELPIALDLRSPIQPAAKGGLWLNFERV